MSIGPIINLASGYIQSLFSGAVNGASSTQTASTNTAAVSQDANQLSPFAQILGDLQQLEQSNLSQYQQVTQKIAGNLQAASQSATAAGNTTLSSQLTQLSTDFRNASTSGQLPNVQDLAQAIGGGAHGHHHRGGSGASDSTGSNLSEFLQSLNASQTGSRANSSLNAQSIIDNTLSSAGIQIG